MKRRRSTAALEVQGNEPPQMLPTVWADWSPAPDGRTVHALRRYCERMDEVAGGATDVATEERQRDLALLMYDVYVSALEERWRDASAG